MATDRSVMALIRALKPSFRNDHDRVAFALHSFFLASGHVSTATGSAACSDTALSSPSTDEVGIDHWNELDDNYAFVYINPENASKKVLVKCLVMSNKLLVDALANGASEPVHLEIDVGDFVGEQQGGANYSAQFKNLEKLVKSLDTEILSKLHGSSKPSSSETSEASRRNTNDTTVGISEPTDPQLLPSGVVLPPVYTGGFSDMFPGPPAGMYPRGDFGGDGGMLVGPGHPMFGGNDRLPGFLGGLPGVPPGARFDPYGPPGVPGFEPNRFVRNPRRPGGGTHPDLEHFGGGSDFI
ncbi:hypothetical protein LWI29_026888 [Acer saccharum]|uniref:Proteasome inhibitor PI31 subunit n=1 Tax=Acer saccharum TaxID=4024 RepID=A0AA39VN64_ACESA|nr:hypothetical protein LWI29_026888 [Acer saccharum]KAK1563588.1 hypothetical protein Q3G72_029641 [Acer saccharum]